MSYPWFTPLVLVCGLSLSCTHCRVPPEEASAGASAATAEPPPAAVAVSPAGKAGVLLAPADFQARMREGNVVVLDVRSAGEYASGHLPGAMLLDVNAPDFNQRAGQLDPSKQYLVYCLMGSRSSRACRILASKNLACSDLAGGYSAWTAASLPVEK